MVRLKEKQKQKKKEKFVSMVNKIKEKNAVVNISQEELPDSAYIFLSKGLGFVTSRKIDLQYLKDNTKEFSGHCLGTHILKLTHNNRLKKFSHHYTKILEYLPVSFLLSIIQYWTK